MSKGAYFRLDRAAVMHVSSRASSAAAYNGADALIANIKKTAPRRSGTLAQSFKIAEKRARSPVDTSLSVYSDERYALYQEFGTGPIYPHTANGVLRFVVRSGAVVFARRTSGVPATRFMSRARRALDQSDFVRPRKLRS